jgi:hypothetical protein
MPVNLRHSIALAPLFLALACLPTCAQQPPAPPQQVVQVGALNVPTAVLTRDNQWSSLLPILSTPDLDLFIEDVSNDSWLARNAGDFVDRGQYTITLVSFYKTRRPCRRDQIRAGFSDAEHVNACDNYRYAVRQIAVDSPQSSVTLLFSAMVFSGGALDPSSIHRETRTRGISELGADAQKALADTTKLVDKQSRIYEARQQNAP